MLTDVRGERDQRRAGEAPRPTPVPATPHVDAAAAECSARAFDSFYLACAPRLVRQLGAMTGDLGEAQDCTQEAFARAWQRWDRIASYDAPEAWVRQVAWRLALSRFRRVRTGAAAWRRHGPPPEVPAVGPDHVALVTALAAIPAAQRRAIVLHHMAGLSVREVAAETGAAEGTVKARLSRGRATLARLLSDATQEDPRA